MNKLEAMDLRVRSAVLHERETIINNITDNLGLSRKDAMVLISPNASVSDILKALKHVRGVGWELTYAESFTCYEQSYAST